VLQAEGVPRDRLVLAALGPKVLGLARDRAAGAIPYLVPPGHTRQARAVLGPGPLLAPEHKVAPMTASPSRHVRSGQVTCSSCLPDGAAATVTAGTPHHEIGSPTSLT
jgi:hypothetical protein